MGVGHQLTNLVHAVGGGSTCAKTGCANIDRISAMINGGDAALQVACRCQQFDSLALIFCHV